MPAAFGLDDEVVAESFGTNDEVVSAFGQGDETIAYPARDGQRNLTVKTSGPALPSDPYAGAAEEMVRPVTDKLPAVTDDAAESLALMKYAEDTQPGRWQKQPQTVGEWTKFMLGGAFSPIKQTETAVESALIAVGAAKQGDRLLYRPSEALERHYGDKTLPRVPPKEGLPGQVAGGVANAAIGLADFLMTPEGTLSLGIGMVPKTLQKIILTIFAGKLATEAPKQFEEAYKAAQAGNVQGAVEHVTSGTAGTVFSALLAKHGALPEAPKPSGLTAESFKEPQERSMPVESVKESPIPKTDQAVESVTESRGAERSPPPPTPVEATSESGITAPVTAGAEPLATATVPPEAPVAKPAEVKPGATAVQKVVDYFKPPPDEAAPAMVVDTGTALPDLQPKEVANAVFSKPFGVEKIPILGRLAGGRARIRTPKDQAVAAWFAERHGVGPAVASSVGLELGGRVNAVFKTDAAGDLNVAPKREGASRKISDVFENIEDYVLSAEQQAVYDSAMKPVLDRHKALSKQYDLLETEVGPEYFPRIVMERPQENVGSLAGGKRVGTKQSFQKERAFDTEAEGWAKGYKYELDVEKRLVTGVEKLYRAMSDKRLANDPVLEGKTRAGLEAELREAYVEEIGAGTMTDAKVTRIADGLQAAGTVWQPGFFGKIFEAETANMLNKEFGREQSSVRRTIANANDFIKAMALGFDVGVGQIQLLPTLYRNPLIWGKANAKALGAMFDPKVWQAYADANQTHIRELAQYGSAVGRLPEMVSGMTGGTIKKVPVLREAAKPFARQFQTALDVAKVELWKAWKSVTPPEQRSQLVQTLESQLTTARMESAMVPQGRALTERVLLLAPSYYRGAVNLVAAMGEKGVSGHIARQAMGSFIFGSTAMFAGVGLSIGMAWEEIVKRLNPTRGDFMLWPVEVGGKKFNVGPGGIFRSFLRLAGNVAKTSAENPGNWKSLAPEKNPLTRWYRGHAGPTVGLAWDQFSGRDFLGNRATMEDIPGRVAPIWMQEMVASRGTPVKAGATAAAEFFGLTTIPPVREGEPHYFVVKEKIASRVGFEEYLNTVARKARTLAEGKQMDYVLERLQKDEVSPKYLQEALGKIKLKVVRE